MPLALQVMGLLGLLCLLFGLPVLLRPDAVRRALGFRDAPQMTYILRITGTMLTALGLILLVFAFSYWKATT
jgi:uncharacterized protein YjeT (DUF2065 family)